MFKGYIQNIKSISDKGYIENTKRIISETDVRRCSVNKLFYKNVLPKFYRNICDGVLF